MSIETCLPLIGALAELSSLYPGMRFGQLIEMIALLASEGTPRKVADHDDDRLFSTASDHAKHRRDQLDSGNGPTLDRPLPAARTELLGALQRVWERHPDWHFGPLVEHLATLSGASLYDAEDAQLDAAARDFAGS
jgi:hypothetical protein